jgi:hypothetical protein
MQNGSACLYLLLALVSILGNCVTVRKIEILRKVPSLSLAMERVPQRSEGRVRPGCWQFCIFRTREKIQGGVAFSKPLIIDYQFSMKKLTKKCYPPLH